jgi:hypothetical protein
MPFNNADIFDLKGKFRLEDRTKILQAIENANLKDDDLKYYNMYEHIIKHEISYKFYLMFQRY